MSYNSLFGLGSHSPDANLEGWWKLQETTGTSAADSSGKGRTGTISGMGSNPTVAAGPNGYLPSAFDFDGSNDKVQAATTANTAPRTILAWARIAATTRSDVVSYSAGGTINYGRLSVNNNAAGQITGRVSTEVVFQNSGAAGISVSGDVDIEDGAWRFLASTISTTASAIFVNGVSVASVAVTGTPIVVASTKIAVGCLTRASDALFFPGDACGVSDWSRVLTLGEIGEAYAGPEPLNTVDPSLTFGASTWTGSVGTWDSQSNGTITYAWELRLDSDDSVVQSGTGSSPSGSNPVAGSYYLWVRASNSGGFDAAEDSVSPSEILSGGGGTAFWRTRQSNQMATVGVIG